MSDKEPLEDPTNRIVAVFDNQQQANAARQELVEHGLAEAQIRVLHGAEAAEQVDTSAKWFADTHEEIGRYQQELKAGNTVISAAVADRDEREKLHALLKRHQARLVTHFGEWITEMMK